jgi:hypothetical protein
MEPVQFGHKELDQCSWHHAMSFRIRGIRGMLGGARFQCCFQVAWFAPTEQLDGREAVDHCSVVRQ